jgi:hypothetical protein
MSHGPNPVVIFAAVGGYLVVLGLIIFAALRFARRRRTARDQAMAQAMAATGAQQVGTPVVTGSGYSYYGITAREYELGGRRVVASNYAVSRYYYRFNLAVATPPMPAITVIPEGKVDRFGKAIGLNREVQTGDPAFDDAAYVDTVEEDAPVHRVFESEAVRAGIRELLSLGYKVQLSSRGLAAFQLLPHGTVPDLSRVSEAVALLGQIAGALPALDPASFKGTIPLRYARFLAFALLWIPLLVLAGLLEGMMGSPGERTLSMGHKGLVLGLCALTAWVVYVALVALRLRGRSYAFRVLLFTAGFGLFGIPTCGVILALALNQALDGSPGEAHAATVVGTSKYKGRCRITVASWFDPTREERLPVSCKHLAGLAKGSLVQVKSHEGALGMPWVEPIAFP